jgi:hypothetical protein
MSKDQKAAYYMVHTSITDTFSDGWRGLPRRGGPASLWRVFLTIEQRN